MKLESETLLYREGKGEGEAERISSGSFKIRPGMVFPLMLNLLEQRDLLRFLQTFFWAEIPQSTRKSRPPQNLLKLTDNQLEGLKIIFC